MTVSYSIGSWTGFNSLELLEPSAYAASERFLHSLEVFDLATMKTDKSAII